MTTLKKFGFCQKIQQYDVMLTSDNVTLSIKLSPDVANDKYVTLCNFGFLKL